MSDKARGSEPALPRQARVERKTKETQIVLQLNVDGTGAAKVETTIPFFNHMLEAWSKHGLMDLAVDARGDTDVDLHHTVEDVGIAALTAAGAPAAGGAGGTEVGPLAQVRLPDQDRSRRAQSGHDEGVSRRE